MINKRFTFFKKRLGGLIGKIGQKSKKLAKVEPIEKKESLKKQIEKNDKKVLMFGWELPPFNSGGLGVACYEMAQSIAKQNTDITFVLPKKQAVSSPFMKISFARNKLENEKEISDFRFKNQLNKKIDLKRVDTLLSPYLTEESYRNNLAKFSKLSVFWRWLGLRNPNSIYGDNLLAEVLRYGRSAASIAKVEKFDVIHAHDWLAYPAGVTVKKISKKPLVVHVHALEYDRSSEDSVDPRVCAIERLGFENADKVIAISNYVKNRIMRYYQVAENKIEVVHNGITIYKKPQKKISLKMIKNGNKKMVLFVGRITYQKGVDYLIKAAAKVIGVNPDVVFMIVGAGDMQYQIIDQAATLGISDKVFFPGFLRGEELENIYRAADVFVMPSVSEPFGLVALEAMVNKVPVIISKQSGAAEVIDHALKVDFWDTDELANKIIALAKHGALRRSLSDMGYKNAERCSWDDAATKLLKIYEGLVTV